MNAPQHEGDARVEEFVHRLGQLDAADRAHLRRNAGRSLADSRGVLGLFYRLAPHGLSRRDEERYFLVATLFPLAAEGKAGNLGDTMRRAQSPANHAGLDRRMAVLLDADGEQLGFRLRQAISLAESNRVPVNWQQLLSDVLRWDDPRRSTQRRWAQSYFGNFS